MDVLLLLFMSLLQGAIGLRCYICTFQYPGAVRDHACLDKPWNVTQGQKIIDCPYPYCVIFRQYMQSTKTIYSFHRGCEQQSRGNKCVLDAYYSTCSYTCNSDLCNSGDGIPVGEEVGQEYIGPPAHDPANRNRIDKGGNKKNHSGKKRKKRPRPKLTCLNPYKCDQSRFYPQSNAQNLQGFLRDFLIVLIVNVFYVWM